MKGIEDLRSMQTEKALYRLGWISIIVIIGLWSILKIANISIIDYLPPCYPYIRYGFYCPGCGGTRAVVAFCSGDIMKSIWYHPFVPYFAVLFLIFMVTHTLEALLGKPFNCKCFKRGIMTEKLIQIKGMRYKNMYIFIGVGIILLQWIGKNIIWFWYEIHII